MTKQLGSIASFIGTPSVPEAKPLYELEEIVKGGEKGAVPLVTSLPTGCYRLTYTPNLATVGFEGTLRIDRVGGSTTVSGDLYRFKVLPSILPMAESAVALQAAKVATLPGVIKSKPLPIPIYPRDAYASYLKGTELTIGKAFGGMALSIAITNLRITADEYSYTQPPAGAYSGTFPAAPTRTVVMALTPATPPIGYPGPYFVGTLSVGGVVKGSLTLGWVSSYFRKATMEIDTLTGSVAPVAVPALSGGGNEGISTTYAGSGWDVKVIYDQVNIPVPAGVNPSNCWANGDLHALMMANRSATTDLDKEWRAHLLIVPGKLGCYRGIMYDSIGVPREGAMAYSDDGYPSTESAWFGTATNKKARDVPRAFMRTAAHELGHVFNLIHQFFLGEGGNGNDIMTTTPEVADFLQGPTTGAPGVFPDDIILAFNEHCRHDLIHLPDIVVRPGGISFVGSSHAGIPEADCDSLDHLLALKLQMRFDRIRLGEPLALTWTLTNRSATTVGVPSDISLKAQHAFLSVVNPRGERRVAPSFVIATEHVRLLQLEPKQSLEAQHRLYWSTNGFAFETPGRHTVELAILWGVGNQAYRVSASADVWVEYPLLARDNEMARLLLDPEVGLYVALGGGPHLKGAVERLRMAKEMTPEAADAGPSALRGYEGLIK